MKNTWIGVAIVGALLTSSRVSAQTVDGKAAYDANCRKCHGVRGIPPKAMKEQYPKIKAFDEAFLKAMSQDSLVKVLVKGKGEDMKSFKDKLSKDELEAVAKYTRELAARPTSGGVGSNASQGWRRIDRSNSST